MKKIPTREGVERLAKDEHYREWCKANDSEPTTCDRSMEYYDHSTRIFVRGAMFAYDAQAARIAELETALQDKDMSLAATWALVLSHEGHIEKLDAQSVRIAELEAELGLTDAN